MSGIGQDQPLATQRLEHLERQAHRVAPAGFVVMGPPAKDGNAQSSCWTRWDWPIG